MSRRKPNKDQYFYGHSDVIPFKRNESPSKRHYRRLKINLNHSEHVRRWCEDKQIKLLVKNSGHHWIFRHPEIQFEWFPSSAKFVINRKYDQTWHIFDYQQVKQKIQEELSKLPQKNLF